MSEKGSLTIVLSQDVIFKPFFLFNLLDKLKKENFKIAKIIEVATKRNPSKKRFNNLFKLWGPFTYFQFILIFTSKKLSSTLPIFLKYKWKSTVKLIAKKHKIKYLFVDSLNNYLLNENFSSEDIVFSFQHEIIKNTKSFKCLIINCHPGDLSKYRGIKPIFWAMSNSESKGIISIHFIDDGIDTGALILEEKFHLNKSLADNYFNAYKLASKVVCEAIKIIMINKDKNKYQKKPMLLNSYKKEPIQQDIKRFKKLNYKTRLSIMNFFELIKIF